MSSLGGNAVRSDSGNWLNWKHLNESQITELSASFEPSNCKGLLAKHLNLSSGDSDTTEKDEVIVDFFFYSYSFCKDLGLSAIKVSTFLGIMVDLLKSDTTPPTNDQNPQNKTKSHHYRLANLPPPPRTIKTSHQTFQSLLLQHSLDSPPNHIPIFTRSEVHNLQTFVTNHYYRHYDLYQYILVNKVRVILIQEEVNSVEVVPRETVTKSLGFGEVSDFVVTFPELTEEEEGGGQRTEEEGGEGI